MNRAELLANIVGYYSTLIEESGVIPDDVPGGMKEPLDDAFRLLGVSESGLATASASAGEVMGYLSVIRWRLLLKVEQALAAAVDIQVDTPMVSARRSQAIANIRNLVDRAEREATAYISADAGGASHGLVMISTDFIEPEE